MIYLDRDISGPGNGLILINHSLSGYDRPAFDPDVRLPLVRRGPNALVGLTADMKAGKVDTLLVAGANPLYDAPAALGFGEALERVDLIVSLNDRLDETARGADYLAPTSHPLECWGDAFMPGDLFAVQQPVILHSDIDERTKIDHVAYRPI